jgi:hypothetical protein
MELKGRPVPDIHCFCADQAQINSRFVTEDFISKDDLFFIPEGADICVEVQYIQSTMFPADDHSVCSIANRREDKVDCRYICSEAEWRHNSGNVLAQQEIPSA